MDENAANPKHPMEQAVDGVVDLQSQIAMRRAVEQGGANQWRSCADLIPRHMREPFTDYVRNGQVKGDFLMAVLRNDFMGAAVRADDHNVLVLRAWAQFLYQYAPTGCFGSTAAVEQWIGERTVLGVFDWEWPAPTAGRLRTPSLRAARTPVTGEAGVKPQ